MTAIHPLRQFRKSQNPPLTQADLAEQMRVGRIMVNRWETGARRITEKRLPVVMQVTGLSLKDLRPDLARLTEATQ